MWSLWKVNSHSLLYGTLIPAVILAFATSAGAIETGDTTSSSVFQQIGLDLVSGLHTCGNGFSQGLATGTRCMASRAVNDIAMSRAFNFVAKSGRALFGKNFRAVNRLSYVPSAQGGLDGHLDFAFPLTVMGLNGPDSGAFFMQQGITRWRDRNGSLRNDLRSGLVSRFTIGESRANLVGVSAFMQNNLERGHGRVVAGVDYAGIWGRGSFNMFMPTTGWRPGQRSREERALAGSELDLRLNLTTTVSMQGAVGRWQAADGSKNWETSSRVGLNWRPHPWLDLSAAWRDIGTADESSMVRAAVVIPFGGPRESPPWNGLGMAVSANTVAPDPWQPIENVGRIRVAERGVVENVQDDDPASIVAGASLRFLQASAESGADVSLEVVLPVPAPSDLQLTARLLPGGGDNPAVPGEDYVDEPIPVTVQQGATTSKVTIPLLRNGNMNEARSLSATLELAT